MAPRRGAFKKRRTTNRRKFRKGGPSKLGYTSLNAKDHVFGFRSKKVSRKAYRSHLWNSTLFSTHYRSILSSSTTASTPAATVTGTVIWYKYASY